MSMIGKTLGNFQCTTLLGKGGMGEVYRAKDQKLGRDVAIKVLPEEFAKDVDRVARFQREAKLLASLNHPNIASIYGLEESDGTNFLVLELIEGDTLADRIKGGPIPVEESLNLALQIAEALEAAHEKGVIHRDLKPANIKVTPDGKVKVLDFGLAKAFARNSEDINLSNSPTLSVTATQQGVILGTAGYMSPEQAKGRMVDRKTDIWAFGCVLFEMLTGKAAFQGDEVSEILASVIKGEANLDLLPANIHPRVREVIRRCLQKEQKKRYPEINQAQYEIDQVLTDPSGVFIQHSAIAKPKKKLRVSIPWVAAVFVLGLIIAGMAVWILRPTGPHQVYRFYYDLPEGQEFTSASGEQSEQLVIVSADGTKIVYVANSQLYLKNSDELIASPIPGSDQDPENPFFSPDGKWIGYFSSKQLKKIGISGGAPMKLCDVSSGPYGATWGADGRIVFGTEEAIMSVSSDGGIPEKLVEPGKGELIYGPSILPGGEWLLFTKAKDTGETRWDEAQIVIQSLKTGQIKVIVEGGSDARYVPTGHLLFALGNNLLAVGFDTDSLKKTGQTVSIIKGVRRPKYPAASPGSANYSVSNSGLLAYVATSATFRRTLLWVDENGKEDLLDFLPNAYNNPRISPDGTMVALSIDDNGITDIWKLDLVRGGMTKLTFDETNDLFPLWTPDGKGIVFHSEREGAVGIYRKSADGTGEAEQLASGDVIGMFPTSWSDNGKILVFENFTSGIGGVDIAMLPMEGDHQLKPLLQGEFWEAHPQVSPNGKWIAYASAEEGQNEIYVCPFPEVGKGRAKISTNGGQEPRWSQDGRALFYRGKDAMMVVAVETEPTLKAGTPKTLFKDIYYRYTGHQWDLSPDGKQFLMIKESSAESAEGTPRKRVIIVTNWFEELKERVPTD